VKSEHEPNQASQGSGHCGCSDHRRMSYRGCCPASIKPAPACSVESRPRSSSTDHTWKATRRQFLAIRGLEAMAAGHAKEFDGTGITVNIIVPGGPTDTAVVPASSGLKREDLIPPVLMTYPLLWLCSAEADGVTGKRYVAAKWDPGASIETARNASEAPIGWPELATAPVWPGGMPNA